ncbi:TPA: phage tail assembly protein [Citrobacter freundii]|nr:phage tail assembly protein [Salmonella enterica]HAT2585598.1 phage tail assembly protein [Citrobacter freundii]HAU8241793.1 phage tail assembly protein [Citrobacter freundii]HCD1230680.1 phage tail assembly protein [Citrobacter freundii]HCD1308563.1 phage tail assembly protein [Citrobacter freundii]
METIELSKEYRFEDYEPTSKIILNLDDLTGSDILEVTDVLQAQGHVSVQTSLDNKVHAALAARCLGRPVEYINGLPARDFVKICQRVQSFLLA